MKTMRLTITALLLGVSSLSLATAVQAHGNSGKPAYGDNHHHYRHYQAPHYRSRPHDYEHVHHRGKHYRQQRERHYHHPHHGYDDGAYRRHGGHHKHHDSYAERHRTMEHRSPWTGDQRRRGDQSRRGHAALAVRDRRQH